MSRVVVHLSDLHFGTVAPRVAERLVSAVKQLKPDVVVISGDLTQRALPDEFEQARDFLGHLPGRVLAIPGNHDVPLYNLFSRFVRPLAKYKQYISEDVEPYYIDSEIAVICLNTARSLTWKNGRLNHGQMVQVRRRLQPLRSHVLRMVVTHHPFDLPGGRPAANLVGRARMAMRRLAEAGADVLLSGHLHQSHVSDTVQRYNIEGHAALVVQAGTATSSRQRGEQNSFNCLRVEETGITVEQWSLTQTDFQLELTRRYRKNHGQWDLLTSGE